MTQNLSCLQTLTLSHDATNGEDLEAQVPKR